MSKFRLGDWRDRVLGLRLRVLGLRGRDRRRRLGMLRVLGRVLVSGRRVLRDANRALLRGSLGVRRRTRGRGG